MSEGTGTGPARHLNRLDGSTLRCGAALHVSLNLAWNVMLLPDALALGGQSITLRLGSVALAVLLVWRFVGRKGGRPEAA
ncbi:hypothetical protein [Xanthomonas sp. 60]